MADRRQLRVVPDPPAGAAVRLSGVTLRRRQGRATITAINDVSLEIGAGECVAVTGPSGSGKSTLLQLIGALQWPDAGSILVDGRNIAPLSRRDQALARRRMGFVFQRYHLLPNVSVLDNVLTPVAPRRRAERERYRERAGGLLRDVGLAGSEQVLARELSGGQQQRVAIARALIGDPQLLLADEPTGNLDSATGEDILDLLADAQAERDMTMLIATHDPVVAAQCNRRIELRDGAVAEDRHVEPPVSDPRWRPSIA